MKVLGITGGVGAGKTTVLNYMEERHGAGVIQADQVAHRLMEPGQNCHQRIAESFGPQILGKDGTIDRRKLGALVFENRKKLRRLNELVHPAVKEWIRSEIERSRREAKTPFLVIEAALLIEEHYEEVCDEIWYIRADSKVRLRRLMESRGYTRERAQSIMANQLPDEVFRRHCQFVVDNGGDIVENTYEQIDRGLIEHGFL